MTRDEYIDFKVEEIRRILEGDGNNDKDDISYVSKWR